MDLSGPCFSSRGGADVSVQCGSCLSIHTQAHYSRTHRIHGVNSQSGCGALRTPDPCSLSSGPSYNARPGEVTVPSIASPDRRVRRRRLCPRNPFFHQQPLNKEGRGSGLLGWGGEAFALPWALDRGRKSKLCMPYFSLTDQALAGLAVFFYS